MNLSNEEMIINNDILFSTQLIGRQDIVDFDIPEEQVAYWSVRACGIACVKMVVETALLKRGTLKSLSLWNLIQLGLKRNAYCDRGWIHRGLLDLLSDYNVDGVCKRGYDIEELCRSISSGHICIISATVGFNGGSIDQYNNILAKGGHLVICKGVRRKGNNEFLEFCFNHPSSDIDKNWHNIWVDDDRVSKSFSGNLIEIPWI